MLDEAGARPPEFFAAQLAEQAPGFGVRLEATAADLLSRYLGELDRWRRRTNLTGPMPPEELVAHALESVLGQKLISHGARVLDIGSGAGLPGIPLAIVRPDVAMTLLEPRKKRAAFLRHALREVPVATAEVREARVEGLSEPQFDAATVRAVGSLAESLGEARFLRLGGSLLAWVTEPEALGKALSPRFSVESIVKVPGTDRRVIARLRKLQSSSPRSTGNITRRA